MNVLGIDIGGSGIKGAVVDVTTGTLVTERVKFAMPASARPAAVAKAVARLASQYEWRGPVGIGFPGSVRDGIVRSTVSLPDSWNGVSLAPVFAKETGCPVYALSGAAAAGLAETNFCPPALRKGVVLLLTVGADIGSALFVDGKPYPIFELGHLELKGTTARKYASSDARKHADLPWPEWGRRLNHLLHHLHAMFAPNRIILGGGVSAKFDRFASCLDVPAKVVPARLRGNAGIVGAALAASQALPKSKLVVRSFAAPATPRA